MKNLRIIEDYLNGSLPDEERKEFEDQLDHDKELADLVKMHAEVNEAIRDHELNALRNKLRELGEKYSAYPGETMGKRDVGGKRLWKQRFLSSQVFRSVAALLLLIAVGVAVKMLFFNTLPAENLYDKYYAPYEPDVVVRSSESVNSEFENAIRNYQQGFYESALIAFNALPVRDSNADLLNFYRGLTYLGLEQYQQAVECFTAIPDDWKDPHVVHRDWYLALACLMNHEKPKAQEILFDIQASGGYYSKKASGLIRRIKP